LILVAFLFTILLFGNYIFNSSYSQQDKRWLKIQSDIIGISMQYPKNWVYDNSLEYRDQMIKFYPASEVDLDDTGPVTLVVGQAKGLPYNNMPLDLYLKYALESYEEGDYTVINKTTIDLTDGTHGYKINFRHVDGRLAFDIIASKNSHSYAFEYIDASRLVMEDEIDLTNKKKVEAFVPII
jgi:hypothetical protein